VWEIFELLHPKPDDLISPERFFVREAEMMMWDEKKKKKKRKDISFYLMTFYYYVAVKLTRDIGYEFMLH
jgi:hypothetical protein